MSDEAGGDLPAMTTFVEVGADMRGFDQAFDQLPAKAARRLDALEQSIRAQMARNQLGMKALGGDASTIRFADDQAKYDALAAANARLASRLGEVRAAAQRKAEVMQRVAFADMAAADAARMAAEASARAATQTRAVSTAMPGVAAGGRNSAMAFLMLSQALEDAQYGFGGIVNNIPGIVLAMGGGAGLAGAVSILAVGLNVASKHLNLFGAEAKKAVSPVDELRASIKKIEDRPIKLLADLEQLDRAKQKLDAIAEKEEALDRLRKARPETELARGAAFDKGIAAAGGLDRVLDELAKGRVAEMVANKDPAAATVDLREKRFREARKGFEDDIAAGSGGDARAIKRITDFANTPAMKAQSGLDLMLRINSPEFAKAGEAEKKRHKAKEDRDEAEDQALKDAVDFRVAAREKQLQKAKEVADEGGKSLQLELLRRDAPTSEAGKAKVAEGVAGRLGAAGVDPEKAARLAKDAVEIALKEVDKEVKSRLFAGQAGGAVAARSALKAQLDTEVREESRARLKKQMGGSPEIMGIDEFLNRLQTGGIKEDLDPMVEQQKETNKKLDEVIEGVKKRTAATFGTSRGGNG